jgi:hypothetical protein
MTLVRVNLIFPGFPGLSLLLIEDMRRPHQLHHFLIQEQDVRSLRRRLLMVVYR